ncbi:YbhB/YbcL family Raf kinase inhibitor-like protein [Halobacteriales archaeon QS_9_68_42]|nr:MAG: YbhB/YbcL family Raf kinase inhibitor-like protein [Halobacteriales archaeon QS_9_68_42]
MTGLTLTSPSFDGGDSIPDRYGYTEEDVNPPLSVDGMPEEAVSLLLLFEDPDAVEPAGHIWDHWLVWDVSPDRETIPENWSPESATEGQNDYGERGYGGPNPPGREHTYRFRLYALDTELGLSAAATRDDVADAVTGHILEKDTLEGTYAP